MIIIPDTQRALNFTQLMAYKAQARLDALMAVYNKLAYMDLSTMPPEKLRAIFQKLKIKSISLVATNEQTKRMREHYISDYNATIEEAKGNFLVNS
jgi:hypothetical protein